MIQDLPNEILEQIIHYLKSRDKIKVGHILKKRWILDDVQTQFNKDSFDMCMIHLNINSSYIRLKHLLDNNVLSKKYLLHIFEDGVIP